MKIHCQRLRLLKLNSLIVLCYLIIGTVNSQEMKEKGSITTECFVALGMAINTSLDDNCLPNGIFPTWELKENKGLNTFIYREKNNGLHDDSSEVFFVFQVPDTILTQFAYFDDEIRKTKALYTYMGSDNILVDSVNFRIINGTIKGKEINKNEWMVSFSVLVKDMEFGIESRFEKTVKYKTCKNSNLTDIYIQH